MRPDASRARQSVKPRPSELVSIGTLLLAVSTAFPVAASLSAQPPARWIGLADALIAFALAAVAFAIVSRGPREFDAATVRTAFRVYRHGASLLLLLVVLFFAAGRRVNWTVLLIGLAWRSWLTAWVLPSAIAVWRRPNAGPVS